MIYIEKNSINNFVLTLSENSRLTNPFYLFEFTNEYILGSTPIYWNQIDNSSYTNRYNLFELVEDENGSTSGGTQTSLNLISGQYNYNVYESTASTLSVSATTGRIVESGRMVVAEENIITTITNNPNSIYY
jgi:hypothetical protein